MPIRLPATLRGRLAFLLSGLFVLVFLLLRFQVEQAQEGAREAARARALGLARAHASQYERLIGDQFALLRVLAGLEEIAARRGAACAARLAHALGEEGGPLLELALFDATGRLLCAGRGGLDPALAPPVAGEALRSAAPAMGAGGEEGLARPYVTLAQPLPKAGETGPPGVLVAFLDRDWLNDQFARTLSPGHVVRLFDREGRFLVRQPDPACCLGKSGRHLPGIGEALGSGREQVTESVWLDGVRRIQADLPLSAPLAGVVSVGIPAEAVLEEARPARRLAWLLAFFCLVLFLLASLFAETALLRPLRRLAAGAAALRAGDFGHRIGTLAGPAEFADLAREFDEMAEAIEARDRRIAQHHERLRLAAEVFAQAAEAITITDAEANIIEVNPRFSEITGYAREEVLGRNPRLLKSGRHGVEFYRAMWEALLTQGRWRGEIWNRRKNGEIYPEWLSIAAVRDRQGRTTHYVAMFVDLSEQKANEAALRDSRERLATLVEALPEAVFLKDGEGRWEVVNGAARRLFALAEDFPWQGKTELELALVNPEFSGEHLACHDSDEDAWAAGRPVHFTEVFHRPGGGTTIHDVTKVPLYDDAGGRRGMIVLAHDVTERARQAEELERRVAERTAALEAANRELEAFSYSISHDLRAPLRAINGFSRLLEEECGEQLGGAAREYLARLRAASLRMGELIDDLLELSRVTRQQLHRQEVDLSALAGEIVEELAAGEPQRRVECAITPGLVASCDPTLARVLLANLLGNAWKYTSKKERARIEFGRDAAGAFFVRDDGAGFDMRYADKLFSPFQRLHSPAEFPGTGIGLATVARIVRRHGGRVWTEAEVGRGATFHFTLPEAGGRPGE